MIIKSLFIARFPKYKLISNPKLIFSFIYWEIILPLWRTPPKLIFGNTIGYRRNIIPRIKFLLIKKNYKNKISKKNHQLIKKLDDNGYLRLKKIDSQKIKLIKEQYDEAFRDETKTFSLSGGAQTLIKDPLKNLPEIKMILEDLKPLLLDMSLGSYYIREIAAKRIYSLDDAIDHKDAGISNAFHNDGISCRDKTIFILLSDNVTKETGATKFISKRESIKLTRDLRYFSRRFLSSSFIKKLYNKAQYFDGSSGDIYFLNTSQCLHGATIPKNGSYRDCILFIYGEDTPPKNEEFIHFC